MNNERAVIGNNLPHCPFAAHAANIDDLVELAEGALPPGDVTSVDMAIQIEQIIDDIALAAKALEATRKAEKAPWDAGAKAVQEIAVPLANKADAAKKRLLAKVEPYRKREAAAREAAANELKRQAAEMAAKAQEAFQATTPDDIVARLDAERMIKAARGLEIDANKLDKAKTGLRSYNVATVADKGAFLKWIKENRADELTAWLAEYAQTLCAAGVRDMAGVTIVTEKRAVK